MKNLQKTVKMDKKRNSYKIDQNKEQELERTHKQNK